MNNAQNLHIRVMTVSDVPFAMELKALNNWNQLAADWERFLEWEPEGCFIAEWDGRPIGTATTIRYEDKFGWVGMVTVHPDMRRKGIGRALTKACIGYLEDRGVAAVRLDATPMGKPLYDRLGFVEESQLERWQGVGEDYGDAGVQAMTEESLEAVCQFDRPLFGADRSRVLSSLFWEEEVGKWVALEEGEVKGYVIIRPGTTAWYLGPLVCTDPEWAERLLQQALSSVAEQNVFLDVCLANEKAASLFTKYRFEQQRGFTRMYRGSNDYPGLPQHTYCPGAPEIG